MFVYVDGPYKLSSYLCFWPRNVGDFEVKLLRKDQSIAMDKKKQKKTVIKRKTGDENVGNDADVKKQKSVKKVEESKVCEIKQESFFIPCCFFKFVLLLNY